MKDLLFKRSEEWVKKHLVSKYEASFVRIPVNEHPELTGKGQKVLFSNGDRVIAESDIQEVRDDEIRFDPLTGVDRPNPERPQENGYKYVDIDDCGQYEIRFMTMVHEYQTVHDLVRGILKNRPETRNSVVKLQHTIWTEVQDLNLNDWSDYENRFEPSTIKTVMEEIQVDNCHYPPTDPDELTDRFKSSPKSGRMYHGLKDFAENAADFYREQGSPGTAETLLDETSFPEDQQKSIEQVKQTVKQKVGGLAEDTTE